METSSKHLYHWLLSEVIIALIDKVHVVARGHHNFMETFAPHMEGLLS
jgi:hypothetical protein